MSKTARTLLHMQQIIRPMTELVKRETTIQAQIDKFPDWIE